MKQPRGFLAQGVELVLLAALLGMAGFGFWQLNRPLPNATAVVVSTIPEGAGLIDARGSLAYRRGHVPGAQQLWSRELLSFEAEVPGTLAEPNTIAGKLQALGLEPGQQVVVYDDGSAQDAPLVVLVLRSFGVEARMLIGGLERWLAAGGELSSDTPPPPTPSDATFTFDRRLLVSAEETLEHLEENLIAPLDAREQEVYLQEHIEAAVNLQAQRLLPSGELPRYSQLHTQLERARLTLDTHPIIYGESLNQAAQAWLALAAYGIPHLHVYAGPYEGLVQAGLPLSEAVSEQAISVPSSSLCWR